MKSRRLYVMQSVLDSTPQQKLCGILLNANLSRRLSFRVCLVIRRAIPAHKESKMTYKADTFKIGRDAKTGLFIPVKDAIRRPSTTVVETVKKPKSK